MENKLAEYRAKREKERKSEESIFRKLVYGNPKRAPEHISPTPVIENSELEISSTEESRRESKLENFQEVPTEHDTEHPTWVFYVLLTLKILLWLILWRYFIEIGFGAVYFIVSVSFLMYRNTRTGPKKKNQLSAYSVFNPNQERLDGTFTSEQFERELRFGAASVK